VSDSRLVDLSGRGRHMTQVASGPSKVAGLIAFSLLVIGLGFLPLVAHCDEPAEPGVSVDVVGFGQVTMSDAPVAATPGGRIVVDGPIAFGASAPLRAYTRLDLTALPGETVDLKTVETIRAVELGLGAYRRIGQLKIGDQDIVTSIVGECGFATKLAHDPAPADRYPRQMGLGMRLEERTSGAWIALRYGRAQVAGEAGYGQWMVAGSVPLGPVRLGGDAVLSVGAGVFRQRDVVRLWVGTSIPDLVAVVRK
jgi:hypothetical protein